MKRNPLQGMIRTWLFDVGSANFLGTGIIMAIMAMVFPMLSDKDGLLFSLMYGLTIVSMCIAITWQVIRLRGTEWQVLLPGFDKHIQLQAFIIYSLVMVFGFGYAGIFLNSQTLAVLSVAGIFGNVFLVMCRYNPSFFHASAVFYLLNLASQSVAELIPNWLIYTLMIITTLAVFITHRRLNWTASAINVFSSGLHSGWMMTPKLSFKWLTAFERFIFPANYFIGPTLSSMLVLIPTMCLIAEGASLYFNWEFPVFVVMLQVSVIIGSMIHWGRLQRPQAFELLITLPIHNGISDLRKRFASAQRRVAYIISGYIFILALVSSFTRNDISLNNGLHILMACYAATMLMMGLSGLATRMWQFTLAMLPVMMTGIWIVIGQEQIIDEPATMLPLMVNLVFILVAEMIFRISAKKMWNERLE
ncbi:hypothetical protein SOPP22_02200 [Shewanella sp. OPT22]|nr:hypothetical protein SOPP22_02200 [Shewanella sp. OPT22]